MNLAPVQPRSMVDAVYEQLQAQVLHGVLAPGDRLPTEAALTRDLGVSRGTVREALNRLASAGLIDIQHGGAKRVLDFRDTAGLEVLGALVAGPSGVDVGVVRAVTEMRSAIAPDVARLAAERRSEAQAAALAEAAALLAADTDLGVLMEQTLAFWTLLVHASGNIAYRLAYNTLRTTYTEGRGPLQQIIAAELRAVDRYRAIARAVSDRDAAGASAHTTDLVRLGADALLAVVDAASHA